MKLKYLLLSGMLLMMFSCQEELFPVEEVSNAERSGKNQEKTQSKVKVVQNSNLAMSSKSGAGCFDYLNYSYSMVSVGPNYCGTIFKSKVISYLLSRGYVEDAGGLRISTSNGPVNHEENIRMALFYTNNYSDDDCAVHANLTSVSYKEYCPLNNEGPGAGFIPIPITGAPGDTTVPPGDGEVEVEPGVNLVAPVEAIDLKEALKGFANVPSNSNTKFSITIHVHSAHEGFPAHEYWNGDPGHAFITLSKVNGNQSYRLSFGFYPKIDSWITMTKQPVTSGIGEESMNDQRRSDIRYTLNVTGDRFSAAIYMAELLSERAYSLSNFNCTDYAIGVFNMGFNNSTSGNKLNVPDSNIGYTTPAGLYQTLDNLRINGNTSISNQSSTPPTSTGY